ncbi:MAG: DNA primase, partial [Solobacterium sp.]|nr:DNA primase [Solobacterium sp.]
MPRISDQDINAVRAKADIVDVISRYLQVQRKGKSYVALCPFHDDHSPSMSISPDRQIYKCFVCGAGGNVFTFVQNYEKVSFTEAVAQVANIVGYPLSLENDLPVKPEDPHKKAMYKVMEEMIRYTIYALNTNEAVLEKQYLEDRGLNDQIRAKFEIGYNPPNDALYHFLKAKGYKESDMVDCNVVRTGPRGINDVFSGRITFPIHDQHGNPIGFSARSIDPNNPSKYINTTDTELFRKSDIVYNYHRAKSQARKEGCVYVTEGVTDVIAFAKAGIDNCVCTLGTSCTDHQIQLLKSLAPKIVFCYDGDDAGQKATWRAAKMALGKNCRVTVIDNQSGKDPDEIVRSQGADGLKAMIRKELTWMEFVLMFLQKHTNMDNYSERREFVRRAEAEISLLEDELDRQHFTDELSRISGFKLNYQPKARQEHTSVLPAAKVPDGFAEAEDIILAMMLASPEAARRYS